MLYTFEVACLMLSLTTCLAIKFVAVLFNRFLASLEHLMYPKALAKPRASAIITITNHRAFNLSAETTANTIHKTGDPNIPPQNIAFSNDVT